MIVEESNLSSGCYFWQEQATDLWRSNLSSENEAKRQHRFYALSMGWGGGWALKDKEENETIKNSWGAHCKLLKGMDCILFIF